MRRSTGVLIEVMKRKEMKLYPRCIKRILDIVFSLTALVLLCWLYAVLAVMVCKKLGRPILFTQLRPGKNERLFRLYKFRSMTNERDTGKNLLPDEQRLTGFGKWLRSTSLDELPQLWNVLRGDMSLIGPRPQLVRDMVFMTPIQRQRHTVRPGITGLAQVSGRNALEWELKLEKDVEYVHKVSFRMDVSIFMKTISQVVFHKKGLSDSGFDEIDLTDDYGVYLLKHNIISQSCYDKGILYAGKILEEFTAEKRL